MLQAAGINGFLYYAPQILQQAGVGALLSNLGITSTSASLLVNVIITFCMLPCIAISMRLMDIAGRRYVQGLNYDAASNFPLSLAVSIPCMQCLLAVLQGYSLYKVHLFLWP